MFAIELHIKRVKGVAAGGNGDANAVVEARRCRAVVARGFVLRFV